MADFHKAFSKTVGHEGGYVFDNDDPGGETNYGISKRSYPDLDIKGLTLDRAKDIYRNDYWLKLKCDEIDDQALAAELFDFGVNAGLRQSVKTAQKAVALLWKDIKIDGKIGPQTVGALKGYKDPVRLVIAMKSLRAMYYIELVRRKPALRKFIGGWLMRVWKQ